MKKTYISPESLVVVTSVTHMLANSITEVGGTAALEDNLQRGDDNDPNRPDEADARMYGFEDVQWEDESFSYTWE